MKHISRRLFVKLSSAAYAAPFLTNLANAETIFASKTASASINKKSDPKPNIIFILADDMGYGEVGCYGQTKIKTPCLDQMAAQGMRFTQHYGCGPVCAPSRGCLMTGRHQGTAYIKGNPPDGPNTDPPLRPQDTSIAEVLKTAGYNTACIGKWGLGNYGTTGYPTSKGFDYFCGYDTHKAAHNYWPEKLNKNDGHVTLSGNTYSHDYFTTDALNYIDSQNKSTPFFLYLAYTIPHSPYDPPLTKADGSDDDFYALYKSESWPAEYKKYAAMISRMDHDISRIIDKLKSKNIDENTLVIFASDNGPGSSYTTDNLEMVNFFQSNGPLIGMKRDVYDGGVREPFIARWPGKIQPNSVSHHISGFQDILPTCALLAGAQPPPASDGISMVPSLLGTPDQPQHDFLYWEFIHNDWGGRQSALMVNGNYKGVRYGSKGKLELYDLDTDIAEQNDIADQHPDIVTHVEAFMATRTHSDLWPMPETGEKFPTGLYDRFIK